MIGRLRARRTRADEDGFVLIYVLMVITIVTTLVSGVLVVTSTNIVPSLQSAYGQAATAAAQGGVQAFLADLDTKCSAGSNNTVPTCSPSSGTNNWTTIYTSADGAYTASYRWRTVSKTTSGTPYVRVVADGRVSRGGVTVIRTITADLLGGSSTSCADYSICTQYETQAPDVLAQQYPARTIALNASAHTAADQVSGSGATSVTWLAPTTGSAANTLNTCNALYYGTGGREYNTSDGGKLADWKQTTTGGLATYLPCQVTLGASTKLLAPTSTSNGVGGYYARDALLLSNSSPGASDGPLLNQPVYTGYQAAGDPYGMAGRNYRSFVLDGYSPQVGGTPAAGSTYPTPQYVSAGPQAITTKPTIPGTGACVYTGPTRILLNSTGTATITSPLTRAAVSGSPAGCYPSAITGGIYGFTTTNLATMTGFTGIFSVTNSGTAPAAGTCGQSATAWRLTCLKKYSDATGTLTAASAANTVIYTDSGALPTSGDANSTTAPYTCTSTYSATAGATCAWTGVLTTTDGNSSGTNGWTTYTSGNNCASTTLASADRLSFECDYNGGTVGAGHDYYKVFRDRVIADLARNTCQSGTVAAQQSCVQSLLTSDLSPGNNSSHRYVISAATPVSSSTTKTLSTNAAPLTGDAFFDSTSSPGTPSTETLTNSALTYTVSRQVYKCYGVLVLGICLLSPGGAVLSYQWGSDTTAGASTPQFTLTVTNQVVSNFSAGAVGKSYFPSLSDVTQYSVGSGGATGTNGPGDLYVEGTAPRSLALVAANDLEITGSLATSSATAYGLQVVAQGNVRVYHPVSCTSTDAAAITGTSAGFCPNDVTGLYGSIPSDGSRPYQQYANLRSDLAGMSINASIFALGTATSPNCPMWNGGGICGGQFTADNYSRGSTLRTLSVTGTIAQVHHGALGQEWEVPDSLNQTRPQSGYNLTATYQNLKSLTSAVNTVDMSGSATATAWHVVSLSSGG